MGTVCETVSFQQTLEDFGRSDYGTKYHADGYGLRSDVKSREREKVLDFMLEHADPNYPMRLLTLPGESWAFEQMANASHRKVQVVGLERSATVFHRAKRAMPAVFGSNDSELWCLQDRILTFGESKVMYARVSAHPGKKKWHRGKGLFINQCGSKTTRSNRLLHMDAETYMTALCTDYRANFSQKKDFNLRFYHRNAVWLDFTSQLCRSVEDTIRHLPMCMEVGERIKPVVLTLMNARDCYIGADLRVERVLSLQPALQYQKHWTYTGSRGTPMLTICATVAV